MKWTYFIVAGDGTRQQIAAATDASLADTDKMVLAAYSQRTDVAVIRVDENGNEAYPDDRPSPAAAPPSVPTRTAIIAGAVVALVIGAMLVWGTR